MTATIDRALPIAGLHPDIPETDYHRDDGSLSSTGAKTLLYEGPRAFQWARTHHVHKDAYDMGSVVHALTLGVGDYDVLEHDSYRTKAAQAERDESRAAGRTPILRKDIEAAEAMRDAIFSNPLAASVLSQGEPEVSMYAECPETGVLMRGRADWLRDGYLVDLKTAAGAIDPAEFERTAWNRHYGLQVAWYRRILALNGVDATPIWVVVSKDAPHQVYVYQASTEMLERGTDDMYRALELYARCQATDEWPGLVDDQMIHTIDVPRWAR